MKKCLLEDNFHNLKTPFFVLDIATLKGEVAKLKMASEKYWSNTTIAYSVKTNSLPYLAKFLSEEGVYAEVVSQDEYELVSLCGYQDNKIVCNGPVKSSEFIAKLMDSHTIINLDSHRELEYAIRHASNNPLSNFTVGLRVNVDVEKYFPTESKAGAQGSRFGFCMENDELMNAIQKLRRCPNISINGLHLHVSTSTRRIEIYRWLSTLFVTLVNQFQLKEIEYFDIGGGFYGGIPNKPQWTDYLGAISEELTKGAFCSEKLMLIMEPGVSLLAGAFSYYASVIDVKDTNRSRFVVTDGSRVHIDPFFHKKSYFYQHFGRPNSNETKLPKQIVVGFTCLEYDNIMELETYDEIEVNDVFRFDKLGAYTISLSPQFISFSPAVYVKDVDGTLKCVRNKLTAYNYIQGSVL